MSGKRLSGLPGTFVTVASFRLRIGDATLYEGPPMAVPRVGEDIHHGDQVVRVEAVVWDFRSSDGVVSVTLLVGGQPYTF
jgi:hypothetical protein